MPNPDRCTTYSCDPVRRTCGVAPIGGEECVECTPVEDEVRPFLLRSPFSLTKGPVVEADCTDKTCGDDGAGGSCGECEDPDFPTCDPVSQNCVEAQLGNRQQPYPLFGTSLKPGAANINPNDPVGIQVFWLDNGATPKDPVEVTDSEKAKSLGWSADGVTVPTKGGRVRILVDSCVSLSSGSSQPILVPIIPTP